MVRGSRQQIRWLLGLLLLVGCAAAEINPTAPPAPAHPTASFTATPQPGVRETVTLIPVATPPATTVTSTSAPPTLTPSATHTPFPDPTATATPSPQPTATATLPPFGDFAPPDPLLPTPLLPYPTPVPLLYKATDTLNIMLLGNDGDGTLGRRTDALMILSINTTEKTAVLLSIPRDLYVYQPGWTLERINLAMPHGGIELLKETLRYNLGLEVDYFVRIGFDGFRRAIDALDGVLIPVICPLEDWRLAAPELDPTVEENWVRFRLETDVVNMDGDLALWYVRSRRTTNDFDRGRRQQQVISAMLEKALRLDVLTDLPALWRAYEDQIMTDIPLSRMVQLATLAQRIQENGVRHLALAGDAVQDARIGEDQLWVQLLQWQEAEPLLQTLQTALSLSRSARTPLLVEVVAANWIDYRLTAETLQWQGFRTTFTRTWQPIPAATTVTYYGPNLKGSYDWLMEWIYPQAAIQLSSSSDAATDYRVELGEDFNACRLPGNAP
jgi:LCP family protein required for cell wall assembly